MIACPLDKRNLWRSFMRYGKYRGVVHIDLVYRITGKIS